MYQQKNIKILKFLKELFDYNLVTIHFQNFSSKCFILHDIHYTVTIMH